MKRRETTIITRMMAAWTKKRISLSVNADRSTDGISGIYAFKTQNTNERNSDMVSFILTKAFKTNCHTLVSRMGGRRHGRTDAAPRPFCRHGLILQKGRSIDRSVGDAFALWLSRSDLRPCIRPCFILKRIVNCIFITI